VAYAVKTRDPGAGALFRFATIGLTAIAGLLMALTLTGFERGISASHERLDRAHDILDSVHVLDGLGWRAVAGGDSRELSQQIESESARLLEVLKAFHRVNGGDQLTGEGTGYASAIRQELEAIMAGRQAEAKEIDDSRVVPAYQKVLASASRVVEQQDATNDRLRRQIILVIWITSIVLTTALAAVLLYLQSRRERNEGFERRLKDQVRFRRLVEGSNDVITVASRDRDIQVMSFAQRKLGRAETLFEVSRVEDLIGTANLAAWIEADLRVQLGESTTVQFPLQNPDGSATFVEAHGSQLDDGSNERAWVWRDVTDRIALERQLTFEAFHDSLTGAANRALLRDRVQHALARSVRSGQPVTVLFFDLDNFKTVNDTLGHALGDDLLRIITDRVRTCAREADTVARLGGDEFAVLVEDGDEKVGGILAERIIAAVSQGVVLEGSTIFPSASVGIAASRPGDSTDDLLRNADTAMFAAKRSGKGRLEVFDEQMHQAAVDHVELQTEIRDAIDRDEFSVHYQPTVSLRTGKVEGVEALVRWSHPIRGSISPVDFIPVAEASGLIVSLGAWVLQEACAVAVSLQKGRSRPLFMHVNLSPRQLLDPKLEEMISRTLRRTGLAPELLVLEVTESLLLDQVEAVKRLDSLHALGVRIAVDDFGTGYTSITYLQRLPVDIVKIDRSFVSGRALPATDRAAFLQAIVGLAQSLKLETVAEGIEDAAQLAELERLGCDAGQGFLWSKAVPSEALREAIAIIDRAVQAEAIRR
jgi:diguanylate cyclase (GGDEF)-like protein